MNIYDANKILSKELNRTINIEDARCREIIREKFKLDTLVGLRSKNLNTWVCEYLSSEDNHLICGGNGKTIAEAEKACITAICKQMEIDDEQ